MGNWKEQKHFNLCKFYLNDEFNVKREELYNIVRLFNLNNIHYNLFCSSSLYFLGITDKFDDYDILVDINDINKARDILLSLGYNFRDPKSCEVHGFSQNEQVFEEKDLLEKVENKELCKSGDFCSDAYYSFKKENIQIELISGFLVNLEPSVEPFYQCNYGKNIEIDGQKIPVVPLEVQFVLYAMMLMKQEKRRLKTKLLYDYLYEGNIEYLFILEEYNNRNIPEWIKDCIDLILDNYYRMTLNNKKEKIFSKRFSK